MSDKSVSNKPANKNKNFGELKDHIKNNGFDGPDDVEEKIFRKEKFTPKDLRKAMEYAHAHADRAVVKLREVGAPLPQVEPQPITFWSCTAYAPGSSRLIPFQLCKGESLESKPIDDKFMRTLVVLCKITRKAEIKVLKLKAWTPDTDNNLRLLRQWALDDDRLNAEPESTPSFLLESNFTTAEIKTIILELKDRSVRNFNGYKGLKARADGQYTQHQISSAKIASVDDIFKSLARHHDMLEFTKKGDNRIMLTNFEPIEKPGDSDEEKKRLASLDVNSKEAFDIREKKIRRERRRERQQTFRWSFAMLAKNSKILENWVKDLESKLKTLPAPAQ